MKKLPSGWQVYNGLNHAKKANLVKERLQATWAQGLRLRKLVSGFRWRKRVFGFHWRTILVAAGFLYLLLKTLGPWPPMVILRHIASFPNCDAARMVDLAPANKGEPGYWPSHDADNDGIACEPWSGPSRIYRRW